MKLTRILLTVVAATTLLLAACNKETEVSKETAKSPLPTNPLLAYAPADTAYVFAALEAAPKDVTDAYIARFQPVFDVVAKKIVRFQAGVAAGDFGQNAMAKIASAIADELGGKIDTESLEKIGISVRSHHALYGMGLFPVIRLELTDAQALRDAIDRIETKTGFQIPQAEFNGTTYWKIVQDGMPVGVYMAILNQQLALSAFPVNAENSLLATFLGQEMPAQSIASKRTLARLNREKGYTSYGSGIIDLQKVADELLNPESTTRSYLGPEMVQNMASFDSVCIAEVKAMIAKAPRVTAGTTSLTANDVGLRFELEMESTLASALSGIVSDIPVAGTGKQLLNASLALNIGKLHSFLLEKANALVSTPYQCEHLHDLNRSAQQMAQQLNIPLPPMINNLMGVRVSVDNFEPQAAVPVNSGLAAVYVDQPQMFVGMANMMIPGFDNLDLANQSEPVKIPADMLPLHNMDVFALLGDNSIGFAIGEKNTADLKPFMQAKNQDKDAFFSLSYDLEKQMKLQRAHPGRADDALGPDEQTLNDMAKAARQVYESIRGTTRVGMKFTPAGLVVEEHTTFQ